MANAETTKLVVIDSMGSIEELGGISGPIINPTRLPVSIITKLITSRKKVFEVNPANLSERIRLTMQNVRTVNFKQVSPKVKANVAPSVKTDKKVSEPVSPKKEEKKTEAVNDFTKK